MPRRPWARSEPSWLKVTKKRGKATARVTKARRARKERREKARKEERRGRRKRRRSRWCLVCQIKYPDTRPEV